MTDAVEETTEGTSEAEAVETDERGRKKLVGGFSFKVPDGHPQQGEKIDKSFPYLECVDDRQAADTLKEKQEKGMGGWRLRDIVNDKLKASSRSNAYQNALMPYRPSEVPQADIRARMIRDLIRSGVPEGLATTTIDGVLALKVAPATS